MKSKKTFVIRKYAYHYNDEYLCLPTKGGIEGVFHKETTAKRKLATLERKAFEGYELGDIEPLSACTNKFLEHAKSFKEYYKKEFGEDIVTIDETGNMYCERGTYLPKGLTNKQIMDIRKHLGIKFYELSAFSGPPHFFGIWEKEPFFEKAGFMSYYDDLYIFFDSYQEAVKKSKKYLSSLLRKKTFKGEIAKLSETPTLLKSFVDNAKNIDYDEKTQSLTTSYLSDNEALALHELLKIKVFEIKTIPFEEVRKIDPMRYDDM